LGGLPKKDSKPCQHLKGVEGEPAGVLGNVTIACPIYSNPILGKNKKTRNDHCDYNLISQLFSEMIN
jgi:hypothetical protein